MEDDKGAFYVVRKGDVVGVYKSISDLQSALRTSANDPRVHVFKGCGLTNKAEDYLSSHGLNNAIYCISSNGVQDDLFGQLVTCPFREPNSLKDKSAAKNQVEKMPQGLNCESNGSMEDDKGAFYVVRKGDVVGVYKSISDIQSALRTSANDPRVHVFKGCGLTNKAEDYLSSHGLNNAIYCSSSNVVQDDLFGQLVTCPFREPNSSKDKSAANNQVEKMPQSSCTLEFDGASKGNPGKAGAGAVLRAADGSMVIRLCEGVGIATNNVAEYRGAILGLRYAIDNGFKHIRVQGDSKLVCMQVQGIWKTKTPNMAELCKTARELKDKFLSFQICHIERAFNTEADAMANQGVQLAAGEVKVESEVKQ